MFVSTLYLQKPNNKVMTTAAIILMKTWGEILRALYSNPYSARVMYFAVIMVIILIPVVIFTAKWLWKYANSGDSIFEEKG